MHPFNQRLHIEAQKRIRALVRLHKRGWSQGAIASRYGISRQRVGRLLKKLNGKAKVRE